MILYFGNDLSKNSFVNLYSTYLSSITTIKSASHFKNRLLRLLHMVFVFFYNLKKTDLIIIDVFSGWAFYYALVISTLSKLFRKEFIPFLHGGRLDIRVNKSPYFSSIILDNSKINITPSKRLQNHFRLKGYEVDYIPNFIELEKFPFKKRSISRPKILWVRSFHKIYNPEMAIKVLYEVSKKYPEVELCMVGKDLDGTINDCKILARKLKIREKIVFKGALPRHEWVKLTNDYDIFLNTTNVESFGLSLIEAAACGMLIVSTNAGEIKFLHDDNYNALLVNINDFKNMSKKIDLLLQNNKLVEKLSINARKNSIPYDWSNISWKWKDLINN